MALADEIREFVYLRFLKPAMNRAQKQVEVTSGEIHDALNLHSQMPSVCEALRGNKMRTYPGISSIEEKRRPNVRLNSSTNRFIFHLGSSGKTIPVSVPQTPVSDEPKDPTTGPADFEAIARTVMSKHFGTALSKRGIQGIPKVFDLVSEDGSIVGDAKYFIMVRGENIPPAKFSVMGEYVWLLEKVNAKHRFLVFGNDRRVPDEYLKRYRHIIKGVSFFFLDTRRRNLEKLK